MTREHFYISVWIYIKIICAIYGVCIREERCPLLIPFPPSLHVIPSQICALS